MIRLLAGFAGQGRLNTEVSTVGIGQKQVEHVPVLRLQGANDAARTRYRKRRSVTHGDHRLELKLLTLRALSNEKKRPATRMTKLPRGVVRLEFQLVSERRPERDRLAPAARDHADDVTRLAAGGLRVVVDLPIVVLTLGRAFDFDGLAGAVHRIGAERRD